MFHGQSAVELGFNTNAKLAVAVAKTKLVCLLYAWSMTT